MKTLTKELLYDMYINQRMSTNEIAKSLGIGYGTAFKYLKTFGIPKRTTSECLKDKAKSIEHRKKLSESKKGAKNYNFGKKNNIRHRCWFTLPNGEVVSMRSQWEAWYAEYLIKKGVCFEYEKKTFVLKNGSAYTAGFHFK